MDAKETEFYKSIPEGIRGKLQEYCDKYSPWERPLILKNSLTECFIWATTPEGSSFWVEHNDNETFPIYSEEQNRFINP